MKEEDELVVYITAAVVGAVVAYAVIKELQ